MKACFAVRQVYEFKRSEIFYYSNLEVSGKKASKSRTPPQKTSPYPLLSEYRRKWFIPYDSFPSKIKIYIHRIAIGYVDGLGLYRGGVGRKGGADGLVAYWYVGYAVGAVAIGSGG